MTIEKWVYGGRGLARLDGQVVLVPFVLPGEVVRGRGGEGEAGSGGSQAARSGYPLGRTRERRPAPTSGVAADATTSTPPTSFSWPGSVEVLREVLRRVGKLDAPEEIAVIAGAPLGVPEPGAVSPGGRGDRLPGGGLEPAVPGGALSDFVAGHQRGAGRARGMMRGHRRFPRFVRTIELFTNESEVQVNVLAAIAPWPGTSSTGARRQFPGPRPAAWTTPPPGASTA